MKAATAGPFCKQQRALQGQYQNCFVALSQPVLRLGPTGWGEVDTGFYPKEEV